MTATFSRLLVAALLATTGQGLAARAQDPSQWSGLHYRNVGPWRGGRVTAVTGVPSQPRTFYMGTVGGGVWKTTDAGHSWTNTTDGQIPVGAMGAVAVADSNPDVIYAGTGSSKIRSNVSTGRGVYKSVDGAKTWRFIGLRDVGQIATIRINPDNPDEVFIAATGDPFKNSSDRGVYRTRDGGKTWKKVLFLNDSLGAADVEMQPGKPNVLYAAMWHGLRHPWTIISGSTDGGLYKSTDGGDSWAKMAGGLPTGLFGRANIGVSAAAPDRLYALIEAKPGHGLYRSDDGGAKWTLVNGENRLVTRPFYYTTLGVDPNNADLVFVGNESWFRSVDGGKTFKTQATPHGDNHDVWINPRDSRLIVQANDGGANVSLDGGATWSVQSNQPTAEMYQVAVDDQYPYRLYGAQQDNTTVIVPSQALGDQQDYRIGPGCETGPIIPKRGDPMVVWGGCKGQFSRVDLRTNGNEQQYWVGSESLYGSDPKDLRYRFQRVAPMEVHPTEPNTLYYGSQYVHRSTDGGVSWDVISPDLTLNPPDKQLASGEPITRDATGEEVYSTVYAIRESTLKPGVIWSGSNDGLVHVTQDAGKSWQNVTPKDLPPGGRVQNIEPGVRAPGTAYIAVYRYLLGDYAPYLYRTDDYGKNWVRLTNGRNGIAADEPTRVIREDPDRPGLLYAGTEFGMHISFDRGARWQPFQLNLPAVPVTDIRLAHGDLILSTQGRGFWILDNLGVLRQLPSQPARATDHRLYTPAVAVRVNASGDKGYDPRQGPEYILPGAQIDYFVAAATQAPVTLTILDAAGNVVRTFSSDAPATPPAGSGGGDDDGGRYRPTYPTRLDATPGVHRFIWDLRYAGAPAQAPAAPQPSALPPTSPKPGEAAPGGVQPGTADPTRPRWPAGPVAPPGAYTVVMTSGSFTARQPLKIVEDPRVLASGVTDADLVAQFDHNMRVLKLVHDTNLAVARVRQAQAELKRSPDEAKARALAPVAARLITPPIRYSAPGLQTHVTYLYSETGASDQKVGRDAVDRYTALRQQVDAALADVDRVLGPASPAR
ncbi:WD40/YVTN/BNR-like repeat-containing protein [Polymorphobacter fuscus]|uniref:Sortilin N-terminal domain-containing protein n=1 Tax=Sandarakinorhabdus fusca TaxID=1439888 RepID=A0A7C9KIF0_9SPHN|nr:hypothetical protein [Polymorphobacter fuscus]KAB7647903.1 hypothetical protein F9290_08075 [Polymorphobacter fuscus]MQT17219.1 hypothetical protein [Polymorphobacter fuscus]NJC08787.1 photosystem II stability/assembly factor-like uncharacterized protein [Polymorphobacter fuscus]